MSEWHDSNAHYAANAPSAETLDVLADIGASLFHVAERLAITTDRYPHEWHAEACDDLVAANMHLRACEAALLLLIGGDGCTVSMRMAARARTPKMAALRDIVRRGTSTARDMAEAWKEMTHGA